MLRRMPSTVHRAALRIVVDYLRCGISWGAAALGSAPRASLPRAPPLARSAAGRGAAAAGARQRWPRPHQRMRHRLSCIAYGRTARAHRGGHSATESTGLLGSTSSLVRVSGAAPMTSSAQLDRSVRRYSSMYLRSRTVAAALWQPRCGSRAVAAALWQPCRPIRCRTLTVDRCCTDKTTTAPRLIVVTVCGSCCADH